MSMLDSLREVHTGLKQHGYDNYANLVDQYIEKCTRSGSVQLGVVGDDLVGKSTVINTFLREKIVPETILPSTAEINIRYGTEKVVKKSDGSIVEDNIEQVIEEDDFVSITVPNEILKKNLIEIKEFHGVFSKRKLSDMFWMSSIYNCDAVVLVMSAEHLLSELECDFINNFIQYVGENRILLVVNKLDVIATSDAERVLDYTKKQIAAKFERVKWVVMDIDGKNESMISHYSKTNLKDEIIDVCTVANEPDHTANDRFIGFVQDELKKEIENLRDKQGKNIDEIRANNRKIIEKREIEKTRIEGSLLEFAQKRNTAVEDIDAFIREEFISMSEELQKSFDQTGDKYTWHENTLELEWKEKVSKASKKTDDYIDSMIADDVKWINNLLDTNFGITHVDFNVTDKRLNMTGKLTPYSVYRKKYLPIGVAGSVLVGYCLFRIVGAVVGLGGGALAFSYLKYKENIQDEEIRRGVASQIRDISSEVRKLTRIEIEKKYDEILGEFKSEVDNILDSRYHTVAENAEAYAEKIDALSRIIDQMEV